MRALVVSLLLLASSFSSPVGADESVAGAMGGFWTIGGSTTVLSPTSISSSVTGTGRIVPSLEISQLPRIVVNVDPGLARLIVGSSTTQRTPIEPEPETNPDPNTRLFSSTLPQLDGESDLVIQEFTLVKALAAGALIGSRLSANGRGFLSEISASITPDQVASLSAECRAILARLSASDGWVEALPFAVDQAALEKWGALVFQTRIEDQKIVPGETVFNLIDPAGDPLDPNNVDGEYCVGFFDNPFAGGCTDLERVSANFERFLIPIEILGANRLFSPPQTIAELQNLVAGDFELHATGDPISGVDGKFAANAWVFNTRVGGRLVKDATVVTRRIEAPIVLPDGPLSTDDDTLRDQLRGFVLGFDPTRCTSSSACFLEVPDSISGQDSVGEPVVAAVPISAPATDATGGELRINLLKLSLENPTILGQLLEGGSGSALVPNQYLGLPIGGITGITLETGNIDLNGDGITDLDTDNDGIWDGADDFSAGPITDDNIFCGSGLPGDLFQDAIVFDPAYADEAIGSDAFREAFPDGLPPRSPVFCRSLIELIDADEDQVPDVSDNCPSVANQDQADVDADGVGDACDNCKGLPNRRLFRFDGETTTGGQRDDDGDGVGNACDVLYSGRSQAHRRVDFDDVAVFMGAIGKRVTALDCPALVDKGAKTACELYDVDGNGGVIGGPDIGGFIRMLNRDPFDEKCEACPLECVGDACGE